MTDGGTVSSIMVLVHSLRGGGAERSGLLLTTSLCDIGYPAYLAVVHREGEHLERAIDSRVQIVALSAGRSRSRTKLRTALEVIRSVRRMNPDVIILNSWPSSEMLLAAKVVHLIRAKLIYVFRSDPRQEFATIAPRPMLRFGMVLILRRLLRIADNIVAVSQGVADDVIEVFRANPGKVAVIHNAVESSGQVRQLGEVWLGSAGVVERPLLVSVGRLEQQKNHALLLRAFARLDPDQRGTLVIAGEGSLRGSLETLANSLGVSGAVHLVGFVEDVSSLMSTSDAVVMPSAWEGFGRVHLEAAALGKAVIATDCPSGPSEIAAHYQDRFVLVPNYDEDELVLALQSLLDVYHERGRLSFPSYTPPTFLPEFSARAYANLWQRNDSGLTDTP